jgi:glutamate synthase (NADPH/NADH) large chain
MLEQHADYANSSKARALIENWQTERLHFKFAMPLWLYKTQAKEFLQQSIDRKEMIEELSQALAQQQIEQVKKAYETSQPILDGAVPGYNSTDQSLMFKLINSFAVLEKAQQCAKDLLKNLPEAQRTQAHVERAAHKLILERPRKLQEALVKSTREAYSNYSDEHLASLLANKRLNDYKKALINRSVQSIYSIGSTAWIIEQDIINNRALANIPCIEEYLAGLLGLAIVQGLSKEQAA